MAPSAVGGRPAGASSTAGAGRFGARALLSGAALLLGAVPFLLLWLLVQRSWSPLAALDGDVAADLNAAVSGSPAAVAALRAVTSLGDTGTVVLALVLATVFLLVRQQRRLAVFTATTGLGLTVLVPLTKAVVDRARPVVDSPVVQTPSNASFPSGHAMGSLVTATVLLVLVLPAARRRLRPWLVAATALVVVAVGASRLALGVHYVSDVLAGWALGASWVALTAAAFRGWQHDRGVAAQEPLDPLAVAPDRAPCAAPSGEPVLPQGRATALRLLGAAVALAAALSATGLLVTGALGGTWLGRLDRSATAWALEARSPALTTAADAVGRLSGTPAVVGLGLSLAVLALAVTRSWRPVTFVVLALGGEVLIYLVTSQLVGRARPEVPDLTTGLPVAAAWPSGHAAAAAALYGAVAAVHLAYGRGRGRWLVLVLPLVLAPRGRRLPRLRGGAPPHRRPRRAGARGPVGAGVRARPAAPGPRAAARRERPGRSVAWRRWSGCWSSAAAEPGSRPWREPWARPPGCRSSSSTSTSGSTALGR
nr:phosphatase PAP2 family protein [uncultured Pseudokineococcus sp.]